MRLQLRLPRPRNQLLTCSAEPSMRPSTEPIPAPTCTDGPRVQRIPLRESPRCREFAEDGAQRNASSTGKEGSLGLRHAAAASIGKIAIDR